MIRIEDQLAPIEENFTLFQELDSERGANVFASRDNGATWEKRGRAMNQEPTFDEHMIVERKDGSLLMYLRSQTGMTQSESFDYGNTWSLPVSVPFPAASARFFLLRLKSGNFLLFGTPIPKDQNSAPI